MPITASLTKLQAVNIILRGAREHPVSSLGASTENDSLMAEQILDELLTREQATGLHIIMTEASFVPDTGNDNRVVLPQNTLEVKGWNQHVHRDYFYRQVDGLILLFDGTPETPPVTSNFVDDDEVFVRITQGLEFEELPLHHQYSIAYQSAQEYQMSVLGSTELDNHLGGRAARARMIARAHDMRSRKHNQFHHGRATGPRFGTAAVPRTWPINDLRQQ